MYKKTCLKLILLIKQWLYPKSPPIPSFTIPYISPLIQFIWRSEWKRVSEFGHCALEGLPLLHICLQFNNNLKRGAPVVRLEDLFNSVTEIMYKINSNSKFTINLYLCFIMLAVLSQGRALLK